MELIEVRDLEKHYETGDLETGVLHGLSFAIKKGEFVSIMGPSGSGKSTLLHILGFLDRPTGGEYFFDGKRVGEYSPQESAQIRNTRIGFVFQSFNLLPRVSVLDNVKLPLTYSHVPEREWNARAMKAVEQVGLGHRASFEPSRLSGGERQRVAIARALINDPDIIFADEPTGNLDSKSGTQVLELIDELHDRGHTIVLVTHETYTAEYADRILTIMDGKLGSDRPVQKRNHGALIK